VWLQLIGGFSGGGEEFNKEIGEKQKGVSVFFILFRKFCDGLQKDLSQFIDFFNLIAELATVFEKTVARHTDLR